MRFTRDSIITLSVFLAFTAALYFIGYWFIFRLGRATPLMLSVGVAAILTCLVRNRRLSSLGWAWGSWRGQWASYLIPLGLATAAYVLIWLIEPGAFYSADFVSELRDSFNLPQWNDVSIVLLHLFVTATITFLLTLPSVLGEEIAWRGFLVPELGKCMSFLPVAIVSGVLWALWHWPIILLGLYGNDVTPTYYQLAMFTIYIVGLSIIMTYLRYRTGSLWTAVIFHMSGNVFMQKFFSPLTNDSVSSPWASGEFGWVSATLALLAGVYFVRKGMREFGMTIGGRGE